jgi:hypothetical protein
MKSGLIVIIYAAIITAFALADAVEAQDQLTRCTGPNGQVIYVTNFTCPAGWIPS